VHLGPARAPWVFSNIDRHVKLFPEVPLVFISDQISHLKKGAKLGVETYFYQPQKVTDELFGNSAHNFTFRHNFWRTSVERLIAIQEYQIEAIQEKMLHIESDVMLMPNFPWNKIEHLDKLAWLSANSFSDCAALLYSPSIHAMNWLIEELKSEVIIKADTTDMRILYSIRKKNPGVIDLFPSTSLEIADESLKSDPQRFFDSTNLTSYFGGLFDVGNMGMWLTGQNPRNLGGKTIRYEKYYTQDNDFDSNSFKLEGNILSIGPHPGETVFNLHVHSKNLRLLSPGWNSQLQKLVNESRTLSGKQRFSISGFLGSQFDIFVSVDRKILIYLLIFLKMDKLVSRIRALVNSFVGNSSKN
jgi:hypothetical protein